MARRACLAIGVSTVAPPAGGAMRFGYLDGAAIAARTIGDWALRSGFGEANVRIVTDERVGGKDNPVTRERVQQAVDELFPPGAEPVAQLVLSFCGHGITDANVGSLSWLFSDSMRRKYRVLADAFYAELLLLGVERITLIADACREAPHDLDLMRLDPVRGIAADGSQVESPKFDRLVACQDGQVGYMVSDPTSAAPGKCVFSGVVADVLWGMEPDAIQGGVITTASFGACVRKRTAARARDYRLKLNPQCLVDPEAAILYDSGKPPQGPPGLQPWPPAATAAPMGPAPHGAGSDPGDAALESVAARPGFDWSTVTIGSPAGVAATRHAAGAGIVLAGATAAAALAGRPGRKAAAPAKRGAAPAAASRAGAAAGLHRSLAQVKPASRPDASNLLVVGDRARLWAAAPAVRGRRTAARIGFRVEPDPAGRPVLLEFGDGRFAPVVPYAGLYALVRRNGADDAVQAYGESAAPDAFPRALQAIVDFTAGRLGAGSIGALAALLRGGKHADPVLGVICAYLYKAIADVDNIRRMAAFYAAHRQPVPFDLALLGAMKVSRDPGGALRLHIPAVAARPPAKGEGGEALPAYATRATAAAEAPIGGRCPWLAMGWDYVNMARPEWARLVEGLGPHAPSIPRGGFTLLPAETGRALARLWGLQPG